MLPFMTAPQLELSRALQQQLWAHAQQAAPEECVGVLGGQSTPLGWRAARYTPLPNSAPRPTVQYQAEPAALIRALRAFRAGGLELAALFHSHPAGPAHPSASDIAQAGYDVPYLIADLRGGTLRAFLLPTNTEVSLLCQE